MTPPTESKERGAEEDETPEEVLLAFYDPNTIDCGVVESDHADRLAWDSIECVREEGRCRQTVQLF